MRSARPSMGFDISPLRVPAAVAMLTAASLTWAQSPDAPHDAVETAATLSEVIVTATKREEPVRKLPQTVNVVEGADLEQVGARELQDFLRYVPGVSLQEGTTNDNRTLSIRGVGPGPGANTTVGVLIDDVSMGDPYGSYLVPDLDPFDLHDVEVLKGPQGTLFGAAALNGAIRYVLNQPSLDAWQGKGFVDWTGISGAGSAPTYGAAVNLPAGKTFALRAVSVYQDLPGLYDDINADGKRVRDADTGYKHMNRIMGLWQPSDQFSASAFYLEQSGHRDDLSVANNLDGRFVRTDTPGPSSSTQRFTVANLDLRYKFDWATLISETSRTTKLQDLNYDASPGIEALAVQGIPSLRTIQYADSRSYSQELRLVSPQGEGPWSWIAGAYYNHYKAGVDRDIVLANSQIVGALFSLLGVPPPYPPVPPQGLSIQDTVYQPLRATESSVFGELTRSFGNVALTLGGRYYDEKLDAGVYRGGYVASLIGAAGFAGRQTMKSDGFNPKASVTWQMDPNVLWYANASQGFQFGGLNVPSPIQSNNSFPMTYKPSKVWSYESGVRVDALGKKLQFDLAAFLLNWKDMQIQQTTPDGVTQYTTNIGRARSKGMESSLRWLTPIEGLMLINTAAYTRATVVEPFTTAGGVFVADGTVLPAAPRWQTATTVAYNTGVGSARTGAALTYSHADHAISALQYGVRIYGYDTLDFNWNLSFPKLGFDPTITLNVTNLTDRRALLGGSAILIAGVQEGALANYMRPRTVSVRLSAQF